jgi:hypothetical protein
MIDELVAGCGSNQGLLIEVLGKMRRLTDRLDAIAGANRARMAECLDALDPLPGAKPDGHLCPT